MLLTIFLAIVFCAAISLMLLSAVAFIQDKKFFSSAPKEAQEVIKPRETELFYGARVIGWALMAGVDRARCMLFTTGRMPADMVAKALRAGIPLLASKTYPTDRGLELARRGRLTLATVRPDGTTLIWTNGQETEGPEEK